MCSGNTMDNIRIGTQFPASLEVFSALRIDVSALQYGRQINCFNYVENFIHAFSVSLRI